MKKILIIFLLCIGFLKAETIRYQTDDKSSFYDAKMVESVLGSSINSDLKFKTSMPVCRDLYKVVYDKNENQVSKTKVDAEKYLIDFNYKDGTFTCSYIAKEFEDAPRSITLSVPNWNLFMSYIDGTAEGVDLSTLPFDVNLIYNLFDGEYKPSNLRLIDGYGQYATSWEMFKEKLGKVFNTTGDSSAMTSSPYQVFTRANQIGLSYLKNTDTPKNFTVSQFVTGLITLNSDYVQGVNENGEIIINEQVSKDMAVLDKLEYSKGFWEKIGEKIGSVINGVTGKTDDVNYSSVFSFEKYFDKQIFGLYYDFMVKGWQSTFDYASLLIIAMVFLYVGVILGTKFFLFRLNPNNEGREWDYPIQNKLVGALVLFVFLFLHFPNGQAQIIDNGINNNNTDKNFEISTTVTQNQEFVQQTTGFKLLINYLSDMGVQIADYASNNIITLYMNYLFKTSNTSSYIDTVNLLNQNRRAVAEQAVLQSFFINNCINSHKSNYEALKGFQTATSHIDLLWGNKNGSADLFGTTGTGTVSPLMCKNLELSLMINREYLSRMKKVAEKNIENLSKNSNFNFVANNMSYTTMAQLYVDTQLLGAKSLGWFMSATLPVSHIFMKNSNIINNTMDGLQTSSQGEAVTTILVNKADAFYEVQGENLHQQTLDTEVLNTTGSTWIKNTLSMLTGYQVYLIMPYFTDIRDFVISLIRGTKDVILEVVGTFVPQGKLLSFAKSTLDKLNKESSETKSKSLASKSYKNSQFFSKPDTKSTTANEPVTFDNIDFMGYIIYVAGFIIAVMIYKIIMGGVFCAVVMLLAVLKIGLYFWECFLYLFISPFAVLYNLTLKDKSEKVNQFFVDGFILFVVKPTVIVFCLFAFIFLFELMGSTTNMLTDIVFSTLSLTNSLFENSSFALSVITESVITGFLEIFIYFIGIVLAIFVIFKGDELILSRFTNYGENGMNAISQKIEKISSMKI